MRLPGLSNPASISFSTNSTPCLCTTFGSPKIAQEGKSGLLLPPGHRRSCPGMPTHQSLRRKRRPSLLHHKRFFLSISSAGRCALPRTLHRSHRRSCSGRDSMDTPGNILHHDRLKVTATTLSGMISVAQTAASWHARDPTHVPMMRAVPTCNVHPLRLADLHKVLPRQFDRALIRLGPGQEEESVREITRTQCGIWALGDLGTREFCSETRRKRAVTERPGHTLGEGTINGQTALSPNKIHL